MAEGGQPQNRTAGLAFAGSILAGIGIGQAFGRPDLGTLIGIGVGFILMAFLRSKGSS